MTAFRALLTRDGQFDDPLFLTYVQFDDDSAVSPSLDYFEVPYSWDGKVGQIIGGLETLDFEDGGPRILWAEGGSGAAGIARKSGSGTPDPIKCVTIESPFVRFQAGDRYSIQYLGASASPQATENTFLSGYCLNSGATFNGFRASVLSGGQYGVATLSGDVTPLEFGEVEFDSVGGYDESTSQFTVPASLDGQRGVFRTTYLTEVLSGTTQKTVSIQRSQDGGSTWSAVGTCISTFLEENVSSGAVDLNTGDIYRVVLGELDLFGDYHFLSNERVYFGGVFFD